MGRAGGGAERIPVRVCGEGRGWVQKGRCQGGDWAGAGRVGSGGQGLFWDGGVGNARAGVDSREGGRFFFSPLLKSLYDAWMRCV